MRHCLTGYDTGFPEHRLAALLVPANPAIRSARRAASRPPDDLGLDAERIENLGKKRTAGSGCDDVEDLLVLLAFVHVTDDAFESVHIAMRYAGIDYDEICVE